MKKALISMSTATLLAATGIPAQAQESLVYVAVEPCRLVDTRAGGGAIPANTSRDFLVSGGSGELTNQGGKAAGCPDPMAGTGVDPVAVSAYIVAVPTATSLSGLLTAFPADQADPDDTIATVNFAAGQVIGNTSNATLCENTAGCPDGPLGIITFNTEQDVVVDVQGYFYPAAVATSCPADMVATGSICMDKYEASLWDAATGGNPTDATACLPDGSDCSTIFAQSVVNATPAVSITWYQAAQACANAGKRLATTAEWQAAASGTIDPGLNSDLSLGCNTNSLAISLTGEALNCTSSVGANDMIGNVWEYTAELEANTVANKFTTTDAMSARALGTDNNTAAGSGADDTSTKALLVLDQSGFANGPNSAAGSIGFRCAR